MRIEVYYWRENGTKELFDHVSERCGGEPSDWAAIYSGKKFPYSVPAGSIHDFFEGMVQREATLHYAISATRI